MVESQIYTREKVSKVRTILGNFGLNFRQSERFSSPKIDADILADNISASSESNGIKDAFELLMSGGEVGPLVTLRFED